MKHLIACLILFAVTASADETPADTLWQKLQFIERQGPTQTATSEADRKANYLRFLAEVEKLCDQFILDFPSDKRLWEAKLDKLQVIVSRLAMTGQPIDAKVVDATVKEITGAAEASKPVKSEASLIALHVHAQLLEKSSPPERLAEFEKSCDEFIAANPGDRAIPVIQFLRLEVYEKVDPTKAADALKALASDKNPAVVAEASRRFKAQEFKSKPLELQFTTVDGKEFNLTKLRGKVVLVDFWATWCGPCRMEIPNIVAMYKKLNAKGFEIVGISLDQQKERLLEFTQAKEMTWPQYFDGKGWGNEVSGKFGITGIPTMWLVDKKGFVRNTEARANLETEIAKLLAE